ncbi:MAG: hypothetical protein OXN97_14575 [Bryobacterales bacterium]|nr:hypothetical protein [Bryobacterales bacterium]
MSSILVRDVPAQTLHALKRLAKSHHRSLQGEVHSILARAARMAPSESEVRRPKLVTVRVGRSTSWDRDEIYGSEGR